LSNSLNVLLFEQLKIFTEPPRPQFENPCYTYSLSRKCKH